MLKVALGTTSKWKKEAMAEILEETKIEAEIISFNVESKVLSQPRGEDETKTGSINRAKEALARAEEAEIGMGIEFGYEPKGKLYIMHAWSSIVDKFGNIYSEQSSTLELPTYFYKFLNEEDEVGHHVEEFKDIKDDPEWKYFSELIQYRFPFLKESARNVLLRYYFREEY